MRVTIHQPEHLPWLGFFHKINMADVYVILDNVQFRKNYFQNRNKIKITNRWCWLTVPVKYAFGQRIMDVLIDNNNKNWAEKYWDSIYFSYNKAPFFGVYSEFLKAILEQKWTHISDLNMALILKFLDLLSVRPCIVKASELSVEGKGTELLLNICQKLGGKYYISGISGKDYLNLKNFEEAAIKVIFQEFHHPLYKQLHEPFIPCMSIIDLLFNYGDKSLEIINGIGVPVMKEIFV